MPPTSPRRAYSYVRLSTEAQRLGDGVRRQLEQSQKYAALQGWELLDQDQLRDFGLSAFSGANIADGAIGRFLTAIRDGKVASGSVLIIESLDRLSRQDPWKAFGLFTEIINAGVDVVTLMDGRTYTVGAGLGDLIFSIVDMSRAHEESRAKSHRLCAAWAEKRNNANTRKMTARCPGWLSLSSDRKRFEVVPGRADLITRIFEDSAAGMGLYSIARRLNEARISPFAAQEDGTLLRLRRS
jgi:DNA invertase Pin-like site-specific DNA recombinase